MKNNYKFKCKTCEDPMVKAGKTSIGKQRYKCKICNTKTIISKEKTTKRNELKLFVKWLIDSTKISDKVGMSRRTFHRKTSWCWNITPKIKSDDISSDFIFIDATYLNRNLCLLIVRNEKYVLGFRWAESETHYDYYALLKTIKEPRFVICDGHHSIIKAIKKLWKSVRIQRCLVHIMRMPKASLEKEANAK